MLTLQLSAHASVTRADFHSENIQKYIMRVLGDNYTLRHLDSFGLASHSDEKFQLKSHPNTAENIQRSLRLNRAGRKNVFGNSTASDKRWCSLLARTTRDLDDIFSVVSMNLSIFEGIVADVEVPDISVTTPCVPDTPRAIRLKQRGQRLRQGSSLSNGPQKRSCHS